MFLEKDELKSAIYEYQLNEIVEITQDDDTNEDIVLMAIDAAIQEMKSYLRTGNYDVVAIFGAEDDARNPLVLELCKSIAVYYVCRLSNVDIIEEKVRTRYDRAIDWLEKVTGIGKYSDSTTLDPDLPLLVDTDESNVPFRMGSRQKFNHE